MIKKHTKAGRLEYRAAQIQSIQKAYKDVEVWKDGAVEAISWATARGEKILKVWKGTAADPLHCRLHPDRDSAWDTFQEFCKRFNRDPEPKIPMKASDHWAVGDIVYNSWGYGQTNVDWYQVTEVLPKSVRLVSIRGRVTETGCMCGDSEPVLDEHGVGSPLGNPFIKVLQRGGRIPMRYGGVSKWDPEKKSKVYVSWYN